MTIVSHSIKACFRALARAPLRMRLAGVATWKPLVDPEPGYTLIIAAMSRLWGVAAANLRAVARMHTAHMREAILVLDEVEQAFPEALVHAIEELRGYGLRVRMIGYSPNQLALARSIEWGWVYSWLSWSLGIGAARTRMVVLHDLDALPIESDLFERLYRSAVAHRVHFQGIRPYLRNGITREMNLGTTFEMFLDAGWLRESFRPVDGFNRIRLVGGRYVDFDTWLAIQWRTPRRRIEPVAETALVHPSQLICQYTDHVAGRKTRLTARNQLPVLAYLMNLGDPGFDIEGPGRAFAVPESPRAELFGRPCALGAIPAEDWAWMEKQIRRLEQHLFGGTRPPIERYLEGFVARAGACRTVGREPIESGGVPER